MAVGQNPWLHFGVGEFTTRFRTYLSGWIGMFTWGYDLGFDPQPSGLKLNHPELDRRFWSMFPLTRATHFGVSTLLTTTAMCFMVFGLVFGLTRAVRG